MDIELTFDIVKQCAIWGILILKEIPEKIGVLHRMELKAIDVTGMCAPYSLTLRWIRFFPRYALKGQKYVGLRNPRMADLRTGTMQMNEVHDNENKNQYSTSHKQRGHSRRGKIHISWQWISR